MNTYIFVLQIYTLTPYIALLSRYFLKGKNFVCVCFICNLFMFKRKERMNVFLDNIPHKRRIVNLLPTWTSLADRNLHLVFALHYITILHSYYMIKPFRLRISSEIISNSKSVPYILKLAHKRRDILIKIPFTMYLQVQ